MVDMNTNRLWILALSVWCCGGPGGAAQNAENQTFEWSTRLLLNPDQEKLLHLYNRLDYDAATLEQLSGIQADIKRLSANLGRLAVRPAKAGELSVVYGDHPGQATILNPSPTNLAFTVSVRGDEQWVGSRKASLGRKTYLPANSQLALTNLYWTTPRMSELK